MQKACLFFVFTKKRNGVAFDEYGIFFFKVSVISSVENVFLVFQARLSTTWTHR